MLNLTYHSGSGDRQIPKASWLDSLYPCEFKAIERPSLNKVMSGEVANRSKALTVFAEDPGSVPSIPHQTAHNHP